jgi:hypothetical protein
MRHSRHFLLDPFKVPGALAPGLRSHFGGVVREPMPDQLAALADELDEHETGGAGDRNGAFRRDPTPH